MLTLRAHLQQEVWRRFPLADGESGSAVVREGAFGGVNLRTA